MKREIVLSACLWPATTLAETRFGHFNPLLRASAARFQQQPFVEPTFPRRATEQSPFLNVNTTKFAVNGAGLPDVDFDVGESYAGSLPVGAENPGASMFFWFFPTSSANASKEIVIWLNGGPGCSSLSGLLQENGPVLWPSGVTEPYANPWSWHQLSNVVWVEQPVGTGFSTGTVSATNEDDVARQFMGFWRNFVDTFHLQGYQIYITGESYAGAYCPYIASNMLHRNDTDYFNVKGMLIYDPVITGGTAGITSTNYFVQYWESVLPFNDTTKARIVNASKTCGFDEYVDKYMTFPPSGQQPDLCQQPGISPDCTRFQEGCDVFDLAYYAAMDVNPAFNIYEVATLAPLQTDVLGFPGGTMYTPPGTKIYFNRTDVKTALHAPHDVNWEICASKRVFAAGGDNSDPTTYRAIPHVIERTNNVQIAHGTMDMVLLANGTLLGIQNMTWNGAMGFQEMPKQPIFVPFHANPSPASASGQGVMGTWHEERGLTWLFIELTGHMVPSWQPAVAFRQLEVLLGRVPAMNSTKPFPQYANASQPDPSELGLGTAPQLGVPLRGDARGTSGTQRTAGHASLCRTVMPLFATIPLWWL